MKKITLIIAMLFATIVSAQNFEEKLCEGKVTYFKKANGEIRYIAFIDNIAFIVGTTVGSDKMNYYASLKYTGGDTPMVKKKGAKIIMENGEVINKPDVEIKIEVNKKAQYEYKAFVPLTEDEIKILLDNKTSKIQLYVMESNVVNPEEVQSVFSCIYNHATK